MEERAMGDLFTWADPQWRQLVWSHGCTKAKREREAKAAGQVANGRALSVVECECVRSE